MKPNKKAQISVDLILVIALILVIFMAVFVTVYKRNDEIGSSKSKYYAKSIADKFANEINMVYLAGDGTSKTVELPSSLKESTEYSITVYPNSYIIDITWTYQDKTMHYSSPIIISDISGNLSGINDDVNISNNQGSLIFIALGNLSATTTTSTTTTSTSTSSTSTSSTSSTSTSSTTSTSTTTTTTSTSSTTSTSTTSTSTTTTSTSTTTTSTTSTTTTTFAGWTTEFFDDFDRMNSADIGGSWTETGEEWDVLNNRGHADDCDSPGDQITSSGIDLSSKSDARLTFDWEYVALDPGECLNLDLNDGSGWVIDVFSQCSAGSNQAGSGSEVINLLTHISLTSTVQLRYDCLSSHANEEVYIDNVNVSAIT